MKTIGELRSGFFTTDVLLGIDALNAADRRSFQQFFTAVIRQRGFPLHTASLWNALYYGWSIDRRSYLGTGLRLALAADGRPIPVGAFVEVPLGGQRMAWAEVVYKEGRDERINELGIADPAASGSRAGLLRARQEATVREGLVLDFDAFGEGINDADDRAFARAQRRRLLTQEGHKELLASYPAADAGLDDLLAFARHVAEQQGRELFADLLRDGGALATDDERWELLLGSLHAVDELAQTADDLITFGHYHLDRATLASDRSAGGDAVFGAEAFEDVIRAATEPPAERHVRGFAWQGSGCAAYRSVGALVREYLDRHGRDRQEHALLAGPGYARLVLEVNASVAERIGERGLLRSHSPIHVRLDDDWEGGGIWRAIRYDGDPPPESRLPALLPLGIGYAESSGITAPTIVQAPPPAERTEFGWRVTLRAIDLHYRHLPLPSEAMELIPADQEKVIVEFSDGMRTQDPRLRPVVREHRVIGEMPYPITFVAGTIVAVTASFGGRRLAVRATPVSEYELEGRPILFEINEHVFREELRLSPMSPAEGVRVRSLTERINEVFRRRGRPTDDGGRALRSEEVIAALVDQDANPAASLPILLTLQSTFEFADGFYVWRPRLTRRTSPRERTTIVASRERTRERFERILAPRMVSMHLRQYVSGERHPSQEKIDSYQWALDHYHMRGRLPDQLAADQTWVEPFPL